MGGVVGLYFGLQEQLVLFIAIMLGVQLIICVPALEFQKSTSVPQPILEADAVALFWEPALCSQNL